MADDSDALVSVRDSSCSVDDLLGSVDVVVVLDGGGWAPHLLVLLLLLHGLH